MLVGLLTLCITKKPNGMKNWSTMTAMSFVLLLLLGTSCEEDVIPTLEIDAPNYAITFSPLAEDEENVKVDVVTNQSNWKVYSEHDWCIVTKKDDYFVISAERNKTFMEYPRKTNVFVSVEGLEPISIPVSQTSVFLDVFQPFEYNLPEEGGVVEIAFACNYEWTVSSSQEWAVVDTKNGVGDGVVKVEVLPSDCDVVTEAKIIIKSGNGDISVLITRDYKHPIYKVGDLYPDEENPIGIVYHTFNEGKGGWVTALKGGRSRYSQLEVYTGATSYSDGAFNTKAVQESDYVIYAFPAFEYCINHGEGWYFPSYLEAQTMLLNRGEVNDKIESIGGDTIGTYLGTSTEYHSGKSVCAVLKSENLVEREYLPKGTEVAVRAIMSFK